MGEVGKPTDPRLSIIVAASDDGKTDSHQVDILFQSVGHLPIISSDQQTRL
jgi:hypothetical protein